MSNNCNVIIDEDKVKISVLDCIKNKKLDFNLLFKNCSKSVKCINHNNNIYGYYNHCNLERYKITEQVFKDVISRFGICIVHIQETDTFEIKIKDITTFLRYFIDCKDANINIEDLTFITSIQEYKITKILYSTGYRVGTYYRNDGIIRRQRRVNE
jgi:hypothetical protein